MMTANHDTKTTTLIAFFGKPELNSYIGAEILFADDFDYEALPKSVRAHKMMTINCSRRAGNEKNEAGLKRLRRIQKALEGHKVEVVMCYGNSITEEEFFAIAE